MSYFYAGGVVWEGEDGYRMCK